MKCVKKYLKWIHFWRRRQKNSGQIKKVSLCNDFFFAFFVYFVEFMVFDVHRIALLCFRDAQLIGTDTEIDKIKCSWCVFLFTSHSDSTRKAQSEAKQNKRKKIQIIFYVVWVFLCILYIKLYKKLLYRAVYINNIDI